MAETMTDLETIREFLSLPCVALPSAAFVNPEYAGNGDAWECLRDASRPESEQRLTHFGDQIRIRADRDGWRDGIIVTV